YADTNGLGAGHIYVYRMRSFNSAGQLSGYSNEATATAGASAPITFIPPPTSLAATPMSSTQINLSWQESTTSIDGFSIERKTGSTGTYAQVGTIGVGPNTYSDSGLTVGTTYFYRLRAFHLSSYSPYSSEASATTLNPPGAPTTLAATPTSGFQVNLTWIDNSNNEDGFSIERKTGAAGTYAEIATLAVN